MTDNKLYAALDQSYRETLKLMAEEGVPIGVDAVRWDLTLHTPRGWQPTMTGAIVQIPPDTSDLPEASRSSHMS